MLAGRSGLRGARALQGAPDLVIEVLSPTTREERALGGKLWRAYERNGVPHYWLVDPEARTIHQHTLSGEPYAGGSYSSATTLGEGDVLTSALFPTVSGSVSRTFRRVRREEQRIEE